MELTENNLLTIQNAHDRLSSSSGCLAWVYDRSHASRKPIGLFLVFYVLAFILGVLLLYNTSSLEWLVLFGVVAGFVTFLAPLLQLNTTGELNWKGEPKGFLQRNSNAVRLFMILEASVDIVLAVYLIDDNTTENLVFELAVGAVICASSALAVLFFGAISNVREWKLDEERLEQKRQLVPLAIVLNDTADVLLISRVVATGQVEAKDVLLYIFLLLNVLISEFSTIFATIAEEKATNTSKSGQESATGLRQAMRNKATAQTVLTGMFIIPSILWLGPLRNQIALWEGTLLFSFPLLVFLWIIYLFISKSRRFFEWSLRGIQTRELIPRTFVGFALTLLAVVDWVENLPFGLQRIVVGSYAMYLLLPIVLRVLGDFVRVDALKRDLRNSTSRSDRYFKTRLTEHELSNFLCEDVIKSTVEVTEIRLERCDVTMYAATAIGEALCSDNAANIHTLSLNGNPSLEVQPFKGGVESIDLQSTGLRSIHASVVSELIRSNNVLTELVLRNNEIGDDGAVALGGALEVNTTLQTLHLRLNKIGDVGAVALGKALRVNTTLQTLDVVGNNIGDEGRAALQPHDNRVRM